MQLRTGLGSSCVTSEGSGVYYWCVYFITGRRDHKGRCMVDNLKARSSQCDFLDFTTGLFPGARGLSLRGERSLAASTNSSRRFFETPRTPRMTSLKRRNSGVESNGAAFILYPSVRGFVSRVPGAYGKQASSSSHRRFPSQFLVSDSTLYNLFQRDMVELAHVHSFMASEGSHWYHESP
jgi:hypothetical protein